MLSFFCTDGGPSRQEEEFNGNAMNQEPDVNNNNDMHGPSGHGSDPGVDQMNMPSDCPFCDVEYSFMTGHDDHENIHNTLTAKTKCRHPIKQTYGGTQHRDI